MKVMIDLLLGGPGETPQTAAETIDFIKQIIARLCGSLAGHPRSIPARAWSTPSSGKARLNAIRACGASTPARSISSSRRSTSRRPSAPSPPGSIKDLIAGDKRFFEPMAEQPDAEATDHNYNDNTELVEAIRRVPAAPTGISSANSAAAERDEWCTPGLKAAGTEHLRRIRRLYRLWFADVEFLAWPNFGLPGGPVWVQ